MSKIDAFKLLQTELYKTRSLSWIEVGTNCKYSINFFAPTAGLFSNLIKSHFNYKLNDKHIYGIYKIIFDHPMPKLPKKFYNQIGTEEYVDIFYIGQNNLRLIITPFLMDEFEESSISNRNFPTYDEIKRLLEFKPELSRDELEHWLKIDNIPIPPNPPTNFNPVLVNDCGICLASKNYNIVENDNPYKIHVLPCGHTFHRTCIDQDFQRQNRIPPYRHLCPLCRIPYHRYVPLQLGGYFNKYQKYISKLTNNHI